jgi:hypothetical protein
MNDAAVPALRFDVDVAREDASERAAKAGSGRACQATASRNAAAIAERPFR